MQFQSDELGLTFHLSGERPMNMQPIHYSAIDTILRRQPLRDINVRSVGKTTCQHSALPSHTTRSPRRISYQNGSSSCGSAVRGHRAVRETLNSRQCGWQLRTPLRRQRKLGQCSAAYFECNVPITGMNNKLQKKKRKSNSITSNRRRRLGVPTIKMMARTIEVRAVRPRSISLSISAHRASMRAWS